MNDAGLHRFLTKITIFAIFRPISVTYLASFRVVMVLILVNFKEMEISAHLPKQYQFSHKAIVQISKMDFDSTFSMRGIYNSGP